MEFIIKKFFNKRISLKATILVMFFLISLILISVLAYQLTFFSKKISLESIEIKLNNLSYSIQSALKRTETRNMDIIELLSNVKEKNPLKLYVKLLQNNPHLYAIYKGYEYGEFYEVINLLSHKDLKKNYSSSMEARWLQIEITNEDITKKKLVFFDNDLQVIETRFEQNDYDPRLRPWYYKTKNRNDIVKITDYKFFHIDSFGTSYSKEIKDANCVISLGVLLDDFIKTYEHYIDKDNMQLFLFKKGGHLISFIAENSFLFVNFLKEHKNLDEFRKPKIVSINGKDYIVELSKINSINEDENILLFADYEKIVEPYQNQVNALLVIFLITTFLTIPLILYFSKIIIKPIFELVRQSHSLKNRKYENISKINTYIYELNLLSFSFQSMSRAIMNYQSSLEDKVKERTKELMEQNEKLQKLSITDKLTDIYNRVKLDKTLQYEFNRTLRYKHIFSIILMDIDYFKSINDNFGHQIGDDVLIECANLFKDNIRNVDILGRWGGEEFLIICPETNKYEAVQLATDINIAVRNHKFKTYPKKITISIGVATFNENIQKVEALVSRADKALYEAKNQGRDRIVAYNEHKAN